ncbi:MAG: bifunctional adenosylcobinamide kinase/adenosylcobinamide-phosphate guanylyltransferase, partial [Coriobacteriia bacterium]|nr:bifunctional adenosylcobinamide kinase/adenosylcobinamide-phosphate guanylyltransferase [Coriobacteriia bacterium]
PCSKGQAGTPTPSLLYQSGTPAPSTCPTTFVYGGCCSGKSTFAEQLLLNLASTGEKWYVATMWPEGPDAQRRIHRHQAMRADKGFISCERYLDVKGLAVSESSAVIPKGSAVLLECLGNLVANEMFQSEGAGEEALQVILEGITALAARAAHLIVVSNEVGSDGAPYSAQTQAFQQVLGALNREVCALSTCAVEMVCGIPVYLKGK